MEGGFNPSQIAVNSKIYCESDSHGLILGILVSSRPGTGRNKIFMIFFPNAQMTIVKRIKTRISRIIYLPSKSDLKIRNSLTNNPEGGMAVALINPINKTIAPAVLYLK
jgi:hypothetical protein